MKIKLVLLTVFIHVVYAVTLGYANSNDFKATKISNKVSLIESTKDGEKQVIIESRKGLVVLNSFWSEAIAQRLKTGITEVLKRDDFRYLINIIDRLDRCGGNGVYEGVPIIGHKAFWDKYKDNKDAINAEVNEMISIWRWKEDVERERLTNLEAGSERAIRTERFMNTCKQRADELQSGFSLVLPTEIYEDRKTIDLGDITLELIWFGKANRDGITVIVIPEEKLALIPDDALSPLHLAPYPHSAYKELDVPRWIQVLEEILEGENAVENVLLCDFLNVQWSRERTHLHLDYIRELWNGVREADGQGKSLNQIYTQFSLENEFAFVKDFPVYKDRGEEWVRPQHYGHIRLFFLQGKNLASEIIKNSEPDSISNAVAQIRKQWKKGADIYIEEAALNAIGYELLNQERIADAVEVFRLNVDVYPESANAYDSYAEALMKSGDSEGAVRNYRKSLELNPENDNAREMLKLLEKK
jgi:tetratricopeptide (TPR) repeat protein